MSGNSGKVGPYQTYHKPLRGVKKPGGGSFLCPECAEGTSVVDSRPNEHGIRRRRACVGCGFRFATQERFVDPDSMGMDERVNATRDQLNRIIISAKNLLKALPDV